MNKLASPFELFGVECGPGWYGLVYPIILYVNKWNDTAPEEKKIEIGQIKEKFGRLEIYVHNVPDEISDEVYGMIKKARAESLKICEECGTTTDVGITMRGWLFTLCKDCLAKRQKRRSEAGIKEKTYRKSNGKYYLFDGANEPVKIGKREVKKVCPWEK
jgi:hypothetical protein